MHHPVSVQTTGGIAVLTVDFQPRNALVADVRVALSRALVHVSQDPDLRAVVIAARGKRFATGADPDDSEDAHQTPDLAMLCAQIEACRLPVIAALHGAVEGGGLELALAAHYRIGDRRATFAFPGIKLGLTPSAGATQRLPRVIGVKAAADILGTGRTVDAALAGRLGLIDATADGPLPKFVLDWIREHPSGRPEPRATQLRTEALKPPERHIEALRSLRKSRPRDTDAAWKAILDCVEASLILPFDAAMTKERAAYEDALGSEVSRSMRHVARAEVRAAVAPTEQPATPARIRRIGVVGCGRIGRGIVATCLDAGFPVTLVEQDIGRLEDGVEAIMDLYDQEIAAKRIDGLTRDRRISQLSGKTDSAALAEADLVIEATPEDAKSKRRVFATLDAVMKRDAILATATSGLDLDGLAAGIGRSDKVIGLHFFPPAYRIRPVEVVIGVASSDVTIATAFDLVSRLGKIPVATGVGDGYVALRMAAALCDAAVFLLSKGCSVDKVDAAMERYGMALGPFKLADAIGLDVLQAIARPQGSDGAKQIQAVFERLLASGATGRGAGRGFYHYPGSTSGPVPNPDAAVPADASVGPVPGDGEICRRCLWAMANRGAHLVQDEVAQRPSDIDLLLVQVFGFPRRKGGPMMAADHSGLPRMKRELKAFERDVPELWKAMPLLSKLIGSDRSFNDLNG